MENREEELRSIAPFLPPFLLHSSSLLWPPAVVEALKALSKGPAHSNVNSGQLLFLAFSDLRNSLSLFSSLSPFASHGYSLFFDDLMARADAARWFEEVLPRLADLLLRLPCLLEEHYKQNGAQTGLRLLEPQQPGSVLLTQELIGALLTCALFCLFPTTNRGAKHLPTINFDHLFACLYESYDERIDSKIKCITHYFERICSSMPVGAVTFERKVLPFELSPFCVSYPEDDFWSRSTVPLCCFEVHSSGFIEDQSNEALEVDFANQYLGGGALGRGAVQEEIRFMINPELIAGMLFLPAMAKNEAIEIVGTERFSNYTGYAGSFQFSGDYVDKKGFDSIKRRKTRIIAIDALCSPGNRQYAPKFLLREINKAFCGFLDQNKGQQWKKLFQDNGFLGSGLGQDFENPSERSTDNLLPLEGPSTSLQTSEGATGDQLMSTIAEEKRQHMDCNGEIGVATGNWGCGAFGGDPELKAIIQWLAASQALRPFISYYTFGLESLQKLDQVTRWIISHQWTVGDLWDMLMQYGSQRLKGDTTLGFFSWLLPSLCVEDAMMLDTTQASNKEINSSCCFLKFR